MKEIRHGGRDYVIENVASSYEHGYEVSYKDSDNQKRSVQFRIILNSQMKLVAIANRSSPSTSVSDILTAREIADAEIAANPSAFHIIRNTVYDMQRLRRAGHEARAIRRLDESNPHLVEVVSRIAELDKFLQDANDWAENHRSLSWKQFMDGKGLEADKREFEVAEKLEVADEFQFHPPLGPFELYCAVSRMEEKLASVVIVDFESLTDVPSAISERVEFGWPRLSPQVEGDLAITSVPRWEGSPKIANHILEKMAGGDCIVVGWTRQTEIAAFDKILDVFEKSGIDPKIVIGSPDGTFSGRASRIRLALGNAPTQSQSTPAPALG
jgi:hypothetical protein